MATPKSQRIGIWIITVVMLVGGVGVYFVAILANTNDNAQQQSALDAYQEQLDTSAAARAASSRPLDGHSAFPFDAASVTELVAEDLTVGTGAEVTATSTIEANYFGWTADGVIFDSTNQNGTVTPATFSLEQVIEGWTKGLAGAKVGTVRKLMIPTAMAYGDTAASQGRPAGPLAFIVEIKSLK